MIVVENEQPNYAVEITLSAVQNMIHFIHSIQKRISFNSCYFSQQVSDTFQILVYYFSTSKSNSASSTQCTNNRQVLLVVNLIVISFCKTIYFVTLACFSVILIYPDSLFSYFTIIILSVMTAVTFPLRPPRLAFAICGWRWQNDVHEIKYSVRVCQLTVLSGTPVRTSLQLPR